MWAGPKGIGPYIRQHFLDTTFRGLYHANAFDLMLLIPYFVVLVLLAGYGAHRYVMVYLYYKHQKKRTTEPAARFEDLPRVTVQLPIFNEQYVVERLLEATCKLDYPRRNSTSNSSTIRPTKPSTSPAHWSSATPRWDIRSPITIAAIVLATRPARWPKD